MDSYLNNELIRQDLQDFLFLFKWNGFLFYFPGFPEESLELQSPSAKSLFFKSTYCNGLTSNITLSNSERVIKPIVEFAEGDCGLSLSSGERQK